MRSIRSPGLRTRRTASGSVSCGMDRVSGAGLGRWGVSAFLWTEPVLVDSENENGRTVVLPELALAPQPCCRREVGRGGVVPVSQRSWVGRAGSDVRQPRRIVGRPLSTPLGDHSIERARPLEDERDVTRADSGQDVVSRPPYVLFTGVRRAPRNDRVNGGTRRSGPPQPTYRVRLALAPLPQQVQRPQGAR